MTVRSLQALLMIARNLQNGTRIAPSDIAETLGMSSAVADDEPSTTGTFALVMTRRRVM